MFKKATSIVLGVMMFMSPLAVSAQTMPSIPPNASIEQLQLIVVQLTQMLQQLLQQIANRGDSGSIRVTAPNGGEQWEIGQLNSITWTPYSYGSADSSQWVNAASDMSVYLERTDGTRVGKIMDQGKASLHTYFNIDSYSKWADGGQYYVRVVNNKTGASDRSDAPFTLLPRGVDLKINDSDGPIQLYDNQPITVRLTLGTSFTSCSIGGVRDQMGGTHGVQKGAMQPGSSTFDAYAYVPFAGGTSTSLYVTCTKADGTTRSDTVQANVDGTAASVKIVYQNGGEKVVLGEPSTVTFDMTGVQSYSAALYKNDQWQYWIYKDVPSGKDGFTWTPTAAALGAVHEAGQVFKIYVTGKKSDGTGYVDDKSDGPFSFISNPVAPATATYKGYIDGRLFITTNNVPESYAIENCKKNAANNPNSSLRCTWGDKEVYNAPASPVTQKNPVINSFAASPTSISRNQVATLSWSASGVANGGCYIFANGGSQTITHSSNWGGTGTVTVSPEATTSYTLWCTSSWKDDSPVATKTLTVTLNPVTASAPSCSVSYLPTTIMPGQKLMVSWAGNTGTRTYTLARNGQKYFTSGTIAASGNATAAYEELGGPGVITRTDTITNSGGTATCTTSVTVAANDRIVSPNALTAGQAITSPSGTFKAYYQTDGHFVIYQNGAAGWATGAFGRAPGRAVMQADGNFVNYDASGNAYWSTGTAGRGMAPYSLVLQDDGNLVIYDANGSVIWSAAHGIASTATPSNTNVSNLASALAALEAMLKAFLAQ